MVWMRINKLKCGLALMIRGRCEIGKEKLIERSQVAFVVVAWRWLCKQWWWQRRGCKLCFYVHTSAFLIQATSQLKVHIRDIVNQVNLYNMKARMYCLDDNILASLAFCLYYETPRGASHFLNYYLLQLTHKVLSLHWNVIQRTCPSPALGQKKCQSRNIGPFSVRARGEYGIVLPL